MAFFFKSAEPSPRARPPSSEKNAPLEKEKFGKARPEAGERFLASLKKRILAEKRNSAPPTAWPVAPGARANFTARPLSDRARKPPNDAMARASEKDAPKKHGRAEFGLIFDAAVPRLNAS